MLQAGRRLPRALEETPGPRKTGSAGFTSKGVKSFLSAQDPLEGAVAAEAR